MHFHISQYSLTMPTLSTQPERVIYMELIVCFCNYGSHLPKRVEMVICGYN